MLNGEAAVEPIGGILLTEVIIKKANQIICQPMRYPRAKIAWLLNTKAQSQWPFGLLVATQVHSNLKSDQQNCNT